MKFSEMVRVLVVCFVCVSIGFANALTSDEMTEVTDTCCSHGESIAVLGTTAQGCTTTDLPEDIEPEQVDTCRAALKSCCQEHLKLKEECNAGIKLAAAKKCSVPKSDVGKTCCDECNFGKLTGESQGKESCGSPTEEGVSPVTALRKHAYYQCCIEAANKPTTTERPTTTTKKATTTQKPKEKCKPNSCDHLCNDDTGKIVCQCRDGFRLQGDKRTCKDINECAEAQDDLCTTEGTVCHNTAGSFKCVPLRKRDVGNNCPPGFKKNHENQVCDDINECQLPRPPCPKYLCENTIGGFKCAGKPGKPATEAPKGATEPTVTSPKNEICPSGFRAGADDECVDIDECTETLDDCQRLSQHCINTHGGFFCQDHVSKRCAPGFKVNSATGICEDIDECEESSELCKRNEVCMNMPGAYTCKSKIDTLPKLASKTCQEGTRLRVGGSVCEDIDECREGTHLCDHFQNCINTFGGHECRCKNGFELDSSGACVDINECELKMDNCRSGSHCLNVLGSFTCTRKPPSTSTTSTTTLGYDYEYYDSEEDNSTIDNETSREPKPTTKPTPTLKPTTKPTTTARPTRKPTTTIKPKTTPKPTARPTQKPTTTIKPTPKPEYMPDDKTDKSTTAIPPPPPLGPQPDDLEPDNRDPNPKNPETNPQNPPQTTTTTRTPYTNRPRPRPVNSRPEDPRRMRPDDSRPEDPRRVRPDDSRPEDPRRPRPDDNRRPRPESTRPEDRRPRPNHTPENPINEGSRNPTRPHSSSTVPVVVEKLPEMPEKPDTGSEFEIDNMHCLFGYVRNENGECVDNNECEGNHHICSNLEVCRNLPGGYVCDCIPGFMRDSTGWCVVTIPANATTTPRYTTSTSTTTVIPEVNECESNRHNCNNLEVCRNRPGGYDCDCLPGFMRDATGWCVVTIPPGATTVRTTTTARPAAGIPDRYAPSPRRDPYIPPLICELGYELDDRRRSCIDIDECATGKAQCGPREQCVNFDGGYRCQCDNCRTSDKPTYSEVAPAPPRDRTVITVGNQYGSRGPRYLRPSFSRLSGSGALVSTCPWGYKLTDDRMCVDIDECSKSISECGPQQRCENFFGGYSCSCPAGHRVIDTHRCEDVNECELGQPCPYSARCVNTPGAFRCECGPGFQNAPGNDKACMDIDECTASPTVCEQGCSNTWGSYRCYCQKGYRIGGDNRTCEDVDECAEWQSVASRGRLCVGQCLNVPGSYQCRCPDGYRLGADKRTCVDINECETGTATCASGGDEVCQNTRGGYHCHRIRCPQGYRLESNHRCTRIQRSCPMSDWGCIQKPSAYTYNFITLVSHVYLPEGSVDLFTMHGPSWQDSVINFELRMIDVQASPGVQPADLACFDMRPSNNICVISLLCSLQGPQTAELELTMALRRRGQLAGTAAARLVVIVSQYDY